jgi:hypothetical protein
MNNLVKLLIKDLLNDEDKPKSVVALFGGGFKPPTVGHFEVVRKALSQFPEINRFVIFVGGGVRDGITQKESLNIWDIYKKHLPKNIEIKTLSSLKDIPKYAENNPNETFYWILGSRQNNEKDVKDFELRKNILKTSYPEVTNIEVKNIITNDSISGTKAREALKANNKEEFLQYIPNIPEREEIWNIVSPVIKEIVTDTEVICDKCGWHWKLADGGDDPYICHNILPSGDVCDYNNDPNINESGEGNATPFEWSASQDLEIFINSLKVYPEYGEGTYTYNFKSDNGEYVVNAFIKTIPTESPFQFLNKVTKGKYDMYVAFGFDLKGGKMETTNFQEHYRIMATIMEIIIDFVNTIDDNVNNVTIREIQFFPKADKGPGNNTDSKRGKLYKAYMEKNINKLHKKYNFRSTADTLYLTRANDSINENQNKTWDLKEGIVSLTKYMVDNGLNIKPLPKVKFISNDKENASNLLGRTAYYNPADKSITLYTMDRHPKDVLRSFSHEMIHHMQNLEGKLDNINTTNTNEGGDLPEMEREAYEKGNMMLRNWEDSIKSEKYLKEYKQYVLTELFEKDLSNIEKISPLEYIVGDGKDIEAKYYFRLDEPDSNKWSIHWNFTNNNKNTSPEAWKKITTTSFKVLKDFINTKNPTYISISGNENKSGKNAKLNIYKSKSFLEKLENIFNNQYLIKNDNEDFILMKSIEEAYKHSINESVRHGKEKYEDALYYWQNLDINSKSKIERWSAIKRKVKREVLQEVYNIKNV